MSFRYPVITGSGLVLLAVLGAPAAIAGDPIPEPRTALLVPGGKASEGYHVGLEIGLPPGWHTYWRAPGDAGIPPTITTEGSENVAGVEIRFPAPERYFDGFSTSIVYHDEVVFPMTVRPERADEPVRLVVSLAYGYCKEICVPATATLSADLDPAASVDPDAADRIARFEARVPVPEAAAGTDHPVLRDMAMDGETLVLTVGTPGPADDVDLFSEAPDGWYLGQPEIALRETGTAVFRLSLKGRPKGAAVAGAPFRFTLVEDGLAVEVARQLP